MSGPLTRHRATLVVLAGLVAAVVVAVLLGGRPETAAPLDPDNPGPDGGRATARVLADSGVEVDVVRSADELADAGAGSGSTVLVTSADDLGRSTARRLADDTRGALLVVVEPGPGVAGLIRVPRGSVAPTEGALAADCASTPLAGLRLEVDVAASYPTGQGCFPTEEGYLVARHDVDTTVLGAGAVLTNDQVLRADNAAVTLRLLGQRDRLVWYVPALADLAGGDAVGLGSLVPAWVVPALWLLLVTVVAVMLWQGRRFGPLVSEPLPVVVRSDESTRSRGRLYRKAGDRPHAAEALRDATRHRVAAALRVPADDPETLLAELARHTGRPAEELRALLAADGGPPHSDHDLIALAGRLAELDREVRHP